MLLTGGNANALQPVENQIVKPKTVKLINLSQEAKLPMAKDQSVVVQIE